MDINYILDLDDGPVFPEASVGLHRPILPDPDIQQHQKARTTQQTLDIIDLCGEDNDTDEHEVQKPSAISTVLQRPSPTGRPTWIAAHSNPEYRATQLAQERKAEADALQVRIANHSTRLEPIRSYINPDDGAIPARSPVRHFQVATWRPMNGPHAVNTNGKPFGLPDDFCEEGFEPCPYEDETPHTQQPQVEHPKSLSSTPEQPTHRLPPIESFDFSPALDLSADDKVRQSQHASESLQAPYVPKRARVITRPASNTTASEPQTQPPSTQYSGSLRRERHRSLRSTWDSDLRTSNSFPSNHSIYQTRRANAAPPGPTLICGRQPAQRSHAAEKMEDVEMADIDDGSEDNDLFEMTDDGWKVVHGGQHSEPDAQQPKHESSGLPHRAGHDSLPANQRLRPLAPRPPQTEYPTPRTPNAQSQHQSPNLTIYTDPPRLSKLTQRFAPATTRPRSTIPPDPQPSHPSVPRPPAQNTATTQQLPDYARGDSKHAVQARKYIALDITDAPCTRCVAKGHLCYRSERGTYWKCAYCQTLRGGRREECVLHE